MRLRTSVHLGMLLALAGLIAPPIAAQSVPTGFIVETLVGSGLSGPHDFCFLPDGRILIAERSGGVKIYAGGSTAAVGTVPSVETGSERGLLSVCADPNFGTNGWVYVWYSRNSDAYMHLDRYTCTGDLANPASTNLTFSTTTRRVIIDAAPDSAFNHNGGTLRFGPDGKLYLSIGDDASSCQAQNQASLQGMLLRMDVSGLGAGSGTTAPAASQLDPGDNPLSMTYGDFRDLMIAFGLRNPFRMNIDPTTNNLYIADVGQNAHEEVDEYVYTMGNLQLVNFGWPWKEGNFNYSSCSGGNPGGLIDPIVDVPQSQGWGSIMSGPRYRSLGGPYDFGMSYDGSVFYSDYFSGQLRRLVQSGSNWIPAPAVPGQPSTTNWATGFSALTSFQQGPDGALYLTQHSSTYSWSGGTLKRIRVMGPVNTVNPVSGDGQVGIAQESFAQPLVVQVLDPMGSPLAGGSVNFSVTGPATLGTTNPVIADGSGFAQTTVAATNFGGAVTVTATTPGAGASATFNLYARNLGIVAGPTFVLVQVQNQSTAAPPTVPYAILISVPGIPPLATPIGPICTDPFNPVTLVLEDSIGLFNFVSLSGTGAVGNPGLVKLYNIPLNSLLGVTLSFQAVGLDPVEGLVRTDCETFAF